MPNVSASDCVQLQTEFEFIMAHSGLVVPVPDSSKNDLTIRLTEPMKTSVGKLIVLYLQHAPCLKRTAKNNALSLLKILEVVKGERRPAELIPLEEVTSSLILKYQAAICSKYCQGVAPDFQREAVERALRSTRSTVNQARCLFSRKGDVDMLDVYKANDLELPPGVHAFCGCKVRGKSTKTEYSAPSDDVVQRSIEAIQLMEKDRNVYIGFWLAIGACLRKSEIRRCRWEHLKLVDDKPRIIGGVGKDGLFIDVPLQTRAYESIRPLAKNEGWMIEERGDRWARRLSLWMRDQGWHTQKTLHELRAYTGSQIYSKVSPVAAMRVLRHKSIAITEKSYVRYGLGTDGVDVL